MSDLTMILPLSIAASALSVAGYAGLRGLGWFGRRERPERVVGKLIQFHAIESGAPLSLPTARVVSFDGRAYVVELTSPVILNGSTYSVVSISARHRGFPVSAVSRRGVLAVAGEFPIGSEFIACVTLA
jgi:hypothetical protein